MSSVQMNLEHELLQQYIQNGMARFSSGDLREAVESFQNGLSRSPNHPVCLFQLGVISLIEQQYSQSTSYLSAVPDEFPDVFLYRGLAHLCAGDRREALMLFRSALQISPDDPLARSGISHALERSSPTDATAFFRDAVNTADSSTLSQCYSGLACNLAALGDYEEAADCMRTAVNHCKLPNVTPVYQLELGILLSGLGQYEEAVIMLTKAINGSTSPPAVAYHNLGVCLLEMEALDDAMSSLTRAARMNPGYPWTHRAMAQVYSALHDYKAAVESLQTAIDCADQEDPRTAELHALLGDVQVKTGHLQAAKTSYHTALELNADLHNVSTALRSLRQSIESKVAVIICPSQEDDCVEVLENSLRLAGYKSDQVVQLVGSNAHPEAIAYALSETASALQNVEQGSLLLYIKCPVGIYKGSDKAYLELPAGRYPVARLSHALSNTQCYVMLDGYPSQRSSRSDELDDDVSREDLFSYLQSHLDSVSLGCSVIGMFDDATQSPFPDFLGAGLSLVRCPSAINAVRLSDCEVCRNHMRRIQENAGAGASDLQAYIHQHLRDDGLLKYAHFGKAAAAKEFYLSALPS